jgi:apolipoprotein N-acyltransferase
MPLEREPGAEETRANIEVRAYSTPVRALSVALSVLAVANLVYIGAHIVLDSIQGTRSAPPLAIALGALAFSGAPWLATALISRAVKAAVAVSESAIDVKLRGDQYTIPIASIVEIRALKIPFPWPGLVFIMKSGRPFRYRLLLADPGLLLSALPIPSAKAAAAHPAVAFGRARSLLVRRGWLYLLFKYGVFPVVFAIIFFRLHQYIVFGGAFGQYHMFGLEAYLKSFATVWVGTVGQLVVYACAVRLAVELLAFPLTWAIPGRAHSLRRAAEIFVYLAYFGLVPAFIAFLLLR